MNLRPLALLALLALLAGCASADLAPTPAPARLPLAACRLSAPGVAASVAAQCGALEVPEDYTRPAGRQISLRVAVLPAVRREAAADPLLLLAGGPGQAATEAFAPLLASLSQVNQSRDLILLDQRGTGGSAPLGCPIDPAAQLDDDPAALRAWAAGCRAALHADPAQYTTAVAVRDLDALRDALGYERLNLLGVSYGTRVALSYLQRYPERVRSLVLDGVLPQPAAIGADMARDGQRALDLQFDRCAAEPACAAAFPHLRAEFAALLGRLAAQPADVALSDPLTGAPTSVRLTRGLAAAIVQNLSYAPETAALLPLLIHTAQADGDLAPLAAQAPIIARQQGDSTSLGMRLAVLCVEDVPFYPADLAAAGAGSYLGAGLAEQLAAPCADWPQGELPVGFKDSVRSAVPALLLSGQADPVTPPENAEQVARGLTNSRQIVAPGQGHNIFFRGCIPDLLAEFLEAGSPAGLDVSCVERLGPTPFFTSFVGP
jgi:pimeloyl-ACP methyl ester carboxylesterase